MDQLLGKDRQGFFQEPLAWLSSVSTAWNHGPWGLLPLQGSAPQSDLGVFHVPQLLRAWKLKLAHWSLENPPCQCPF